MVAGVAQKSLGPVHVDAERAWLRTRCPEQPVPRAHQRGRIQSWRDRASRLQLDKAIDSLTFGTRPQLKRRALRSLTRRGRR
jgi:hypothetical protein